MFEQIQYHVNQEFEELMRSKGVREATDEQKANWPLDQRALPRRMLIGEEVLVVPAGSDLRMLDYYGGFEYVEEYCRMQVGNWVVFSNECSRVAEVLDALCCVDLEEE